jgi:hypothetical protein
MGFQRPVDVASARQWLFERIRVDDVIAMPRIAAFRTFPVSLHGSCSRECGMSSATWRCASSSIVTVTLCRASLQAFYWDALLKGGSNIELNPDAAS